MKISPVVAVTCLLGFAAAAPSVAQSPARWKAHDMSRPRPPVVQPPPQALPVPAPPDAVVLFDGKSLADWRSSDGGPAKWVVKDGAIESVPGSGYLYSARGFGDVQLHVEWAAPVPAKGTSQGRGNSGVFLMGLYEVQVLDSYQNDTYPDGQAAAIYGQYPPLVNACRPPGEWQTYDIVFRRPRFRPDGGARVARARHRDPQRHPRAGRRGAVGAHGLAPAHPLLGPSPTSSRSPSRTTATRCATGTSGCASCPKRPSPARPADPRPVVNLPLASLDKYVGKYKVRRADGLHRVATRPPALLRLPVQRAAARARARIRSGRCPLRWTAGELEFDVKPDGAVAGFTFTLGGDKRTATKVE